MKRRFDFRHDGFVFGRGMEKTIQAYCDSIHTI